MHFRSDPPAAPLVQQQPTCYSWKSSSSSTNAPRGKVIDLPLDVALRLLAICKFISIQMFGGPVHWGQVAWSKAKDFTRKQFKRCCIRDLVFVVALTCTTAALNFTFPAGHFLPLSCLSLHIVSFHILSPLKQSLLLHPSPVSTCFYTELFAGLQKGSSWFCALTASSYGICIQRSHANLSPVFKLCVVGLRAKLLLSSTERNQLKRVRHLAMFCQNNTWEWLQITYYSCTLLEFLIVKVHTHTLTQLKRWAHEVSNKSLNTIKDTTVTHHKKRVSLYSVGWGNIRFLRSKIRRNGKKKGWESFYYLHSNNNSGTEIVSGRDGKEKDERKRMSGVSWVMDQWSGVIRPQTSVNKERGERPAAHQQLRGRGNNPRFALMSKS